MAYGYIHMNKNNWIIVKLCFLIYTEFGVFLHIDEISYINYFFCHCSKTHDQGNLQKSLVLLMVAEGRESIMARKHSSKQQAWQ